MPRKKKEVVETPVETTEEVTTEEVVETPVETATEVVVMKGAEVDRVYRKEKHGDNFAELAAQYAKKHGYTVK